MVKEVYEKNIASFINYAYRKDEIVAVIEAADSSNVIVEQGLLSVKKDNRMWGFNSKYDSVGCAKTFAAQYKDIKEMGVLTVVGFGNGDYIRALLEETKVEHMIVYEPREEIFKAVIENIDVSDILEDKRVCLAVGDICKGMYIEYMGVLLSYSNAKISKFTCLPNYNILFKADYENIAMWYEDNNDRLVMNRNTIIKFSDVSIKNSLKTIPDAFKQYSIVQLIDAFEECGCNDRTAFLISAGPSLDKNVHLLKEVKGKHLIIVVDTALKTVLRQGIVPDIAITVDAKKPEILFEHESFKDIPLIMTTSSNYKVKDIHRGKRFYYVEPWDYFTAVCKKCNKQISDVDTGGSVANTAFSVLIRMGYKKIVLVGQDLAFPDNKHHSKDAFDGKEKDVAEHEGCFYVKDIYGNDILTRGDMDHYRKWFESRIMVNKDVEVVDATEGGALIKGTKVMTLRETIDELKSDRMNVGEIIDSIKPLFSEIEQAENIKNYNNVPNEIESMREHVRDGIKKYKRLVDLAAKGKTNCNEYKKLIKGTGEMNEWLDSEPVLVLANIYSKQVDYEVQDVIYDYDENASQYSLISKFAEYGIKVLNSYLDGLDKVEEIWREVIEEERPT